MLTASGPFVNIKISAAEWALSLAVGLLLYCVLAWLLVQVKSPAPINVEEPGRSLLPPASTSGRRCCWRPDGERPTEWITGVPKRSTSHVRGVGYLLPFEIVSVHLLVVLIGCCVNSALARRRRGRPREPDPSLPPPPARFGDPSGIQLQPLPLLGAVVFVCGARAAGDECATSIAC